MRLPGSIFLSTSLLALAWAAPSAGTVTFRVTEISDCPVEPGYGTTCFGEEVTTGFRVEGEPDEPIRGIGASIHGYDPSVVSFVSGAAVDSVFHAFADPDLGAFGGLENSVGGALSESAIAPKGNRVQFLNALSPSPRPWNPLDPGLDGAVGGGDAQFRLTFQIVGPGISFATIGTGYPGDVVVLGDGSTVPANNVRILFSSEEAPRVIPEPGSALLLGVGLGALARRRRRARARPSMARRARPASAPRSPDALAGCPRTRRPAARR
jgi:hypothetical protein